MGVENSVLKRKGKNHSGKIQFKRKNSKNKTEETLDNKNLPNLINNFQGEVETFDTRPQSRTVKIVYPNPKSSEEIPHKIKRENMKDLKSLSTQNLVKIKNNSSIDEALPDSLETNCCSNKSKDEYNKMLNDELYDDVDDNNSFEEEDSEEESEEEDNTKNETDEEKKKKELMVTNNMKAVFKDLKTNKEHNENSSSNLSLNENSRISTLSMTAYDYELLFYRNGNDIRQSYLAKLVSTQIWTPNMKPKQHNSIIIFDWDDTLLPTSFLTPGGVFNENIKLPDVDHEKISKLEQTVLKLLEEAVQKGNVYIITNAGNGWVEYSANRFYPSIMPVLQKIKIISARGLYEKKFPGNSRQWKIEAFLNIQKNINMKLVTNIICVGDSLFEMEAGRILASKFTEAFIKTIKFREAPKLDELLKQLKLVCTQFGSIYSSIKNLTIRVERKRKE
jgi:hypothetical protein